MDKVKTFLKDNLKSIKIIGRNLSHLVEAAALLVVAGYAIWSAQSHDFANQHADKVVLFSGVLIGIRGAWELIKSLNRK